MDQPIISHERIRRMAQEAFERGDPRESCAMKDRAPARQTWLLEFDRLTAAQASPACHVAPHRLARLDPSQGSSTSPHKQGA